MLAPCRDGVSWWHNGETAGYTAAIFTFPPKHIGVVVLCNTATEHTTELGEKILQASIGMKPDPIVVHKVVEVDPEILKKYPGTYVLSLAMAITITLEDGKLMAQATNQSKQPDLPGVGNQILLQGRRRADYVRKRG